MYHECATLALASRCKKLVQHLTLVFPAQQQRRHSPSCDDRNATGVNIRSRASWWRLVASYYPHPLDMDGALRATGVRQRSRDDA